MLDEDENVNAIRKLTEEFDEVCLVVLHVTRTRQPEISAWVLQITSKITTCESCKRVWRALS